MHCDPEALLALLAMVLRSIGPSRRLLRATRPDVILMSTVTIPLWGLLGRLMGIGVLAHVQEAEAATLDGCAGCFRSRSCLVTSIVVNSQYTLGVLADGWARLVPRTRIVTNPVRGPELVQQARTELTEPYGCSTRAPLAPQGSPTHRQALDQLRAEGLDASLEIVGSVYPGYEWFEEELHEQVTRLGMADRVRFLGFRTDVWPNRAERDLAVVPSIGDESFGNAAVESMLAARPAVVSTSGGLAEAIRGYGSALPVPPGDVRRSRPRSAGSCRTGPTYRELAAADARAAGDRQSVTQSAKHRTSPA